MLTWHELGWPVRVAVIASLPGGFTGLFLLATLSSSRLLLLTVPPSILLIPFWILQLSFLFSLPLGGIITIFASATLLFRPMDKSQAVRTALSVLALSLIVLLLSLPQLFLR
jgi:hypothetical protein